MKAYLLTTATVFGLITVAHIWRIYVEGMRLAKDPVFVLLTFATTGMCFWAGYLLRRSPSV